MTSESAAFILASLPATPSDGPTRASDSSSSVIHLAYTVISDNGGSAILSYQVDLDDGQGGEFQTLY